MAELIEETAEDEAPDDAIELPSLSTRIEWFEDWEESTRENRKLARLDRDYYDSKQWTPQELEVLAQRGQPAITKNFIAPKINTIRGDEISKRTDPVARPRTPQHEDAARAATDTLRFVADEQKFPRVKSAVTLNVLVEGYGGAIKSIEEGPDRFKHVLTHVQWDRLFYDPHSRSPDFSDSKYLGIILWMDIDDAVAQWPDAEEALRAALTNDVGDAEDTTEDTPRRWIDRKRNRVKICEMYSRVGQDWYRYVFTAGHDIEEPARTSYLDEFGQHSICPLVMVSCYVDQEGNRYGVVRSLVSIQDEINKRSSKSLHLLSVNQVISERDSISDPQKFQTELAKPDGFPETEPGALTDGRIQIRDGLALAASHVDLAREAKADMDRIGPSAASIPDLPSGASGRAVIARQQSANKELGSVFDYLNDWALAVYERDWLCVRQYWPEEVWLRVTDNEELDGYRFVALNRRMTRAERLQELLQKQPAPPFPKAVEIAAGTYAPVILAQAQMQAQMQAQQMGGQPPQGPQAEQMMQALVLQNPLMQEVITANQVDQMHVDIVIDVAPDTAILAQEEFETLGKLAPSIMQARPDMGGALMRMMVKASDLPNKRELLKEFDKGPDPQQQRMQQMQQQIAVKGAQAQVAVTESQALLNQAKAQSEQAKTQMAGAKVPSEIEKNRAAAMRDAASAGAQMGAVAPQGVM